MGQGQYWARRNLDDQKRLAAAAKRAEADRERAAKISIKEAATREHSQAIKLKAENVVTQQNARNMHFDHIQREIALAISAMGAIEESRGETGTPIEEGSEVYEALKTSNEEFNELAGQLSDGSLTLNKARLAKHIVNARRMFVAYGVAMNIPTKWDSKSRVFSFGNHQLNFDEPV